MIETKRSGLSVVGVGDERLLRVHFETRRTVFGANKQLISAAFSLAPVWVFPAFRLQTSRAGWHWVQPPQKC